MVRRTRMLAVVVVAVAMLGAACGGGGDRKEESSSDESTTTTAAKAATATSTGQPTVRTLGKTGWYKGFAITVDTATLAPPRFQSADLELAVTYENLTTETANVPRATNIVQDG